MKGGYRVNPDHEDQVAEKWRRERPDLDPSSLQVVGRVLRLAQLLKGELGRALGQFDLSVPGFSVLAALRREGAPYALTPTALSKAVSLTSGAMTNRIDRLEKAGFVERVRSEVDRRSVLVRLTPAGQKKIDKALPAWFLGAESAVRLLDAREEQQMVRTLRKLCLRMEAEAGPASDGDPGGRPAVISQTV
ncbi:MAG: MarR family transcriptional regulator [Gemmatimonadales bacterium]